MARGGRVAGAWWALVRRGFEGRIKLQLPGPWPDACCRLGSCLVAPEAPQCEAGGSARLSVLHLMLQRMTMLTLAQIGEPWRDTETLCAESDWHSSGAVPNSNPSHEIPSRGSIRADPSAPIASGSKRHASRHSMAANGRVFP